MRVCVIGAGLMGSAICYDLLHYTSVESVSVVDNDLKALSSVKKICKSNCLTSIKCDVNDKKEISKIVSESNIIISAVPYFFNEFLTKVSIEHGAHFIDLGGNNDVVATQKSMHDNAINKQVTVIPDSGLAPGLVSVITKEIVDEYEDVDYVNLRVGGLPLHPKPPLNYEIVFSPNGLINEYLEDAVVLNKGKLIRKQSLTDIEEILFPTPFGKMEAFITSGGCSTLPLTYKNDINYLDYKTIRYPGHCEKMKTILDLGFGSIKPENINGLSIIPRQVLIHQLEKKLPKTGDDVVLLKVMAQAKKDNKTWSITYMMIDYKDHETGFTAMMRTTGFPVSITADFLANGIIKKPGVFCPEEIIPSDLMFQELKKRNIHIKKDETLI